MYFKVEQSLDNVNWNLVANVRTKFQCYEFQSKATAKLNPDDVKGFEWQNVNDNGRFYRIIENSTNAVPIFKLEEYQKLKDRDVRNALKKQQKSSI